MVHDDKYLGLPSLVGRKKKESFNFIKEKVWSKITKLGKEAFISGGVGDLDNSGHSSNSNICYGVL